VGSALSFFQYFDTVGRATGHPACKNLLYLSTAQPEEVEMWANAQRDGRPAEYRWRPQFNAAKFG